MIKGLKTYHYVCQKAIIDILSNDKDNDGQLDPESIEVNTNETNGTVTITNGKITYEANDTFVGTDTFKYTVKDNEGAISNEATVTIYIKDSNANYEVDFEVLNDWGSGFTGRFTITNTGDEPLEDWMFEFEFGHQISAFYTVDIDSHVGNKYVVTPKNWNSIILPGKSLVLGFNGNPGNVIDYPVNCVVK